MAFEWLKEKLGWGTDKGSSGGSSSSDRRKDLDTWSCICGRTRIGARDKACPGCGLPKSKGLRTSTEVTMTIAPWAIQSAMILGTLLGTVVIITIIASSTVRPITTENQVMQNRSTLRWPIWSVTAPLTRAPISIPTRA